STPAATIGVRGTHFEVVHVLPQIASPDAPAGTYNRVFEGITTVQNPAGAVLQVVRDQTAFAALQGGTPALVAPPALIFGRPTPVPRAAAPQGDAHKSAAIKGEDRAHKMGDRGLKLDARALKRGDTPAVVGGRPILREPLPTTPLETTAIPTAPLLTPIDPVTTIQIAPTSTTTSPTTTIVAPTILQAPTTTTIKLDSTTPVLTSPTLSTSPTTTTTTTSPLTSPTLSSPTLIRR
ncbi:MAG TPA: hypothetical protein VIQ55_02240, partial [Burkholderiales bacterium]